MINVLISVVVPIFNIEKYLEKCIESIISQSYKNLEIILVDDGSTDRCPEICDYYSEMDDRIHVIHKKNGGLVSARKAGTAAAKGDYILNVDGDDWIERERIEVLVTEGILPNHSDMVYMIGDIREFEGYSILIDSDVLQKTYYGDEIRECIFPLLFDTKEVFRRKIRNAMWSWAIRTELLQKKQKLVDDRITVSEDEICIWFCLLEAKSVTLVKQSGYHYIQRELSIMHRASVISENNISRIRIWYQQLKHCIKVSQVSEKINMIFVCMTVYFTILADYELLLSKNTDYLYPFVKVKKNTKIIIYGAGKVGHSLIRYLSKTEDYQVMLWVDKYKKRTLMPGYGISTIEDIPKVDYDYIVIAILNADIVKEIKKTLMCSGVCEEKIAVMDASVITEDAIPDAIKN